MSYLSRCLFTNVFRVRMVIKLKKLLIYDLSVGYVINI